MRSTIRSRARESPSVSRPAERVGGPGSGQGCERRADVLDLDSFKPINDEYGHDVGDKLLIAVGDRLRRVRASDSVGRLGGDEFAILLAGACVEPLVSRLDEAFSHPFDLGGRLLTIGASVGCAAFPADAGHGRGADPRGRRRDVLGQAGAGATAGSFAPPDSPGR